MRKNLCEHIFLHLNLYTNTINVNIILSEKHEADIRKINIFTNFYKMIDIKRLSNYSKEVHPNFGDEYRFIQKKMMIGILGLRIRVKMINPQILNAS